MKFGGTSVGSADRMRVAARLSAEKKRKRPVVIVVSAMSGVTDLLIETTKHAEAGDRAGLGANIRKLEERHHQACHDLLPAAKQKPVLAGIRELVGEFRRITHGMLMLNDRPPRSVDEAIAIGEPTLRAHDCRVPQCRRDCGTGGFLITAMNHVIEKIRAVELAKWGKNLNRAEEAVKARGPEGTPCATPKSFRLPVPQRAGDVSPGISYFTRPRRTSSIAITVDFFEDEGRKGREPPCSCRARLAATMMKRKVLCSGSS